MTIYVSDTMMAEIMDGKNILGAKELLEINRASWYQNYSDTYNDIMNIYLTDTVHEGLSDSITFLMERDFRLGTKYSLAFRLLEQGEPAQAENTISSVPLTLALNSYETEEYRKYYSYFGCMKRAFQNSATITFDSLQTARLDSLVSTDTDFIFVPTVLAKNALQDAGLITYNEKVTFDSSSVTLKSDHGSYFKKYPKNYFKVYPNPATDYIIADYKADPGADLKIAISNLNGDLLKIIPIRRTEDQKVIPLAGFENGAYIFTLFSNNKPISSLKIIVNK